MYEMLMAKSGIKLSRSHHEDRDAAVSTVSLKRHTIVSYGLWLILSTFWNLSYKNSKNLWLHKNKRKLLPPPPTPGGFKNLETISIQLLVSESFFYVIWNRDRSWFPLVSTCYKDNRWISFGISKMSLVKRRLDISGLRYVFSGMIDHFKHLLKGPGNSG